MTLDFDYFARPFKILFWRLAAWMLAFGLRHRRALERVRSYAPIAAAGLLAFLAGRLIGLVLLTYGF